MEKKIYSAQGKGHSPGEYRCAGNSLHRLYFVYDKFTAELPVIVHSCLIFSWCLVLHFPCHWLMVRSVAVLHLFSCYLNINWRQYPTTQVSSILKTRHQIGWHHPKPNSTFSFATSPLKSCISHPHGDGQSF